MQPLDLGRPSVVRDVPRMPGSYPGSRDVASHTSIEMPSELPEVKETQLKVVLEHDERRMESLEEQEKYHSERFREAPDKATELADKQDPLLTGKPIIEMNKALIVKIDEVEATLIEAYHKSENEFSKEQIERNKERIGKNIDKLGEWRQLLHADGKAASTLYANTRHMTTIQALPNRFLSSFIPQATNLPGIAVGPSKAPETTITIPNSTNATISIAGKNTTAI